MGLEFRKENNWYEILINLKWPHEGFTLGYDIIQPDQQVFEVEDSEYVTICLYLGPITLILNYGITNG